MKRMLSRMETIARLFIDIARLEEREKVTGELDPTVNKKLEQICKLLEEEINDDKCTTK